MKKQVKKVGRSIGIIFSKEEQEIYKISKDKIFEIELNEIKEEKND